MDQQNAAASVRALQITESPTRYIGPGGGNDGPRGFEAGGVPVQQATKSPDFPGEVVLQIVPETVQVGDPFTIRVRINNKGNTQIGVKTLEMVSTYGSQPTGKGHQLTPLVPRVNARDNSVIFETRGNWGENQKQGRIDVTVNLVGGGTLQKTIQWQ
jgi:hypothetical protein